MALSKKQLAQLKVIMQENSLTEVLEGVIQNLDEQAAYIRDHYPTVGKAAVAHVKLWQDKLRDVIDGVHPPAVKS